MQHAGFTSTWPILQQHTNLHWTSSSAISFQRQSPKRTPLNRSLWMLVPCQNYMYISCFSIRCKYIAVFTRVSQMKTLNIIYLVIYRTQKVHNDIIFLRSLHCVPYSVPALWKCMDTSRKKSFGWECSHSCTAWCTSSSDLKDASHHLFEWSKNVKITWGEVWRVWRMWKTLGGQISDCCNSWWYDIFVNCNWVVTQWQQYSTHLHTNNT
jgi:hypothetical protein